VTPRRLIGWGGQICSIVAAVSLLVSSAGAAEYGLTPGDSVVGILRDYVVRDGDNLADIARHYDIGYTEMLAANPGVDPWSPGVGRRLTLPSLFILPDAPRRGIVINLAERRLYYFPPGSKTVQTYPIGIGAIGFTTPLSTTTVVRKEPNPIWVPPPSIHEENPDLPAAIGPGPDNPLGAFALRLGWKNYLIHGTNKPDGVGRNVSHGCIHLYPEDIEQLFNSVPVGTPVRAIDQSAAAAWIGIGLYVEVHPSKEQADAIDTEQAVAPEPADGLRQIVQTAAGDYADAVNWDALQAAALQRTGLPVVVAMRPPAGEEAEK
jgi:L,D-transpeptidase ErfK/SrfK